MRDSAAIIKQILEKRGVTDFAEFFSGKPQETYDPFLIPDMERGAEAVFRHISEGKNICVYGDYDVDGLMSVTLFVEFLESLPGVAKGSISWYIPSRFDEGYGLNLSAIEQIKDVGTDLIVTVDCGIASAAEAAAAIGMGMEIVVTDHHEPNPVSIPACPAIDPKMPGSLYPFDGLCGCGVVFKLAQAIKNMYYADDSAVMKNGCYADGSAAGADAAVNSAVNSALAACLDLVAIATVADVMPLRGENRTLVKYGLRALNAGKRWQLRALAEAIGLKQGEISAYNIAFGIAPHLNAAGRMGDASCAVELFRTDDPGRAESIIADLMARNADRRREQDDATRACGQIIDEKYSEDYFLLVKPPRVHEGVAGIVAGRIKEEYGRPAAVLASAENEGAEVLKGSARSIAGVDIISILRAHQDLFIKFGGHAMAAGFTISPENEDALRRAVGSDVKALADGDPGLLSPLPASDADVLPGEISLDLAVALERFEPTGAGNPKPVLCIRGQTPEGLRRMGADGRHLKFLLGGVECVMFARGDEPAELPAGGGPFDVYGSLSVNRWNGRERVQLVVRELVIRELV